MELNPVFVKELRQAPLRRKPAMVAAVWLALTAALTAISMLAPPGYPLWLVPMLALPMVVPALSAGSFAREYEQQTWQDLTLTRLTNSQVVLGKFFAGLSSALIVCASLLPPMLVLERLLIPQLDLAPGLWVLSLGWKVLLSAAFCVLLTMTCSRYSSTRRQALTCSYVALGLYVLLGALIWTEVGASADQNAAYLRQANENGSPTRIDPAEAAAPGFMGGVHLIFCSVVGTGTIFLLWVSLSEQRGYDLRTEIGSARQAVLP